MIKDIINSILSNSRLNHKALIGFLVLLVAGISALGMAVKSDENNQASLAEALTLTTTSITTSTATSSTSSGRSIKTTPKSDSVSNAVALNTLKLENQKKLEELKSKNEKILSEQKAKSDQEIATLKTKQAKELEDLRKRQDASMLSQTEKKEEEKAQSAAHKKELEQMIEVQSKVINKLAGNITTEQKKTEQKLTAEEKKIESELKETKTVVQRLTDTVLSIKNAIVGKITNKTQTKQKVSPQITEGECSKNGIDTAFIEEAKQKIEKELSHKLSAEIAAEIAATLELDLTKVGGKAKAGPSAGAKLAYERTQTTRRTQENNSSLKNTTTDPKCLALANFLSDKPKKIASETLLAQKIGQEMCKQRMIEENWSGIFGYWMYDKWVTCKSEGEIAALVGGQQALHKYQNELEEMLRAGSKVAQSTTRYEPSMIEPEKIDLENTATAINPAPVVAPEKEIKNVTGGQFIAHELGQTTNPEAVDGNMIVFNLYNNNDFPISLEELRTPYKFTEFPGIPESFNPITADDLIVQPKSYSRPLFFTSGFMGDPKING